jgi:DNA-binding transcriptional ArsR family regulator
MPTISSEQTPLFDYDAEETLVVDQPEQLRALADALRARIVAMLRDRARSTTELASELGLPKGTVGHHLKVLERAGLIHVVRTRQVRAMTEKFYGRTARLYLLRPAEDAALAGSLAAASLRAAADDLNLAPGQDIVFGVVRARLADADVRRFRRRFVRLIEDFRAHDADGKQYVLAAALFPRDLRG